MAGTVKIVQLVSAILGFVQSRTDEQWAVMAATNRSRAKEDASSDFRQHIQWAVEKVSSDNQFEVSFSHSVIQYSAKNRPKHLSKKEHELVLEIQETLERLQVIEDIPEDSRDTDDPGPEKTVQSKDHHHSDFNRRTAMTVDIQKQPSGLPQVTRLSEERATALIREQRTQMAAVNAKRRKELESPSFSIIFKRKGFNPAVHWALDQ